MAKKRKRDSMRSGVEKGIKSVIYNAINKFINLELFYLVSQG